MWSTNVTGGTVQLKGGNARRQMAEPIATPLRVALLPDEKNRLDGRILALEKEIEELTAPVAELEAALRRKAEAITAAPEEDDNEAEGQRRESYRRV
jgi:hypothetical protein